MTTTVSPTYPAAGEEVTLATTLGDADAARFEVTSVPAKSALGLGLLVDAAGKPVQAFTPDVPGEYGVTAYGYWQFIAPAAYPGDPVGGTREKLMGTESTTVQVGGYVELPIVPVNGHASTLRLLVVNDTVRTAALANPATELARVAAEDPTVAARVAALVGVAVNSLDVDFVADVNDLASKYEAHRVLTTGTVHNSADVTNALLREPASSIPNAILRLNDIALRLTNHEQALSSGGTWHDIDDGKNVLQVAPVATTLGEATILKADLRERVYERHRIQTSAPASHRLADTTNAMSDPATLPAAIVAYLDYIATNGPDAASRESEGITDAQAAYGFRAAA